MTEIPLIFDIERGIISEIPIIFDCGNHSKRIFPGDSEYPKFIYSEENFPDLEKLTEKYRYVYIAVKNDDEFICLQRSLCERAWQWGGQAPNQNRADQVTIFVNSFEKCFENHTYSLVKLDLDRKAMMTSIIYDMRYTVIKFEEIYETKPEYMGHHAGKQYGI